MGFICAPLIFPTGDSVIAQPVAPNKNPVIYLLIFSDGIHNLTAEPSPLIKMTTDKPINISNAVPASSYRQEI